ncbi:MAG: VapC toxin family PIN domain ribonuclease [Verrucomicrobia bacterium]|nr:VapC toxin family PIN domain ribonuclease [Verrucomicrobiota bacterium]
MILMDVNVLVYAFRKDSTDHARYRDWLQSIINSSEAYGISDIVLSGFLRIVTHPKVFKRPSTRSEAFKFVQAVRNQPNCRCIACGERNWEIFSELCHNADARGNLVADAFLAALAVESGCEWISTDRDFARFPGLKWRHPLSGDAASNLQAT